MTGTKEKGVQEKALLGSDFIQDVGLGRGGLTEPQREPLAMGEAPVPRQGHVEQQRQHSMGAVAWQ